MIPRTTHKAQSSIQWSFLGNWTRAVRVWRAYPRKFCRTDYFAKLIDRHTMLLVKAIKKSSAGYNNTGLSFSLRKDNATHVMQHTDSHGTHAGVSRSIPGNVLIICIVFRHVSFDSAPPSAHVQRLETVPILFDWPWQTRKSWGGLARPGPATGPVRFFCCAMAETPAVRRNAPVSSAAKAHNVLANDNQPASQL